MSVSMPDRFVGVIENNDKLYGCLLKTLHNFSSLFNDNKLEFFPEYTDHGIEHVQSVLNTAEVLITKGSWNVLTPEDVYVLCVSILLHDSAMHLSRDGLWDLLGNDKYNGVLIGFIDEDEWSSRWSMFCAEVDKYDEPDWFSLFGRHEVVRFPKIGASSLNDNQKILIGEFIRKYHANLAQVISTYGLPSKGGPCLLIDDEFSSLNQIAGFIARSHNHNLRAAADILGDDQKRKYRDTHPAYLMGVLRIADYLQFTVERTPKILFKTKTFCSPVSIREWKKHLSIVTVHDSHPDDELIFIEAYPEDAVTLVDIKRLMSACQAELDEYWAVNGEVYSRYPPLDKLGIKYRRVRSNIDDSTRYIESHYKSFYPEVLRVQADNQQLFPLLIKPLYGDSPEIGIRELLQNSVDACYERFGCDVGSSVNYEEIPYGVTISINRKENSLTISDQGIGMNVDVIKNYFLRVGASFRTSDTWRGQYSDKDNVFIPRTGKFGIGMLAGFLIGDKISVHTRHHNAEPTKSISFEYRLDSMEIELKFSKKNDIGTTITIVSDEARLSRIENGFETPERWCPYDWDDYCGHSWWYFLDSPTVRTYLDSEGDIREVTPSFIIEKKELLLHWNAVEDTQLEGYFWRRSRERIKALFCNGVIVKDLKTPRIEISLGLDMIVIDDLQICVFDNHGIFPLNLTRDGLLSEEFFEISKLKSSVKQKYLKDLKANFKDYSFSANSILKFIEYYSPSDSHISPVIFEKEKPLPMIENESIKSNQLVFVDFIYPNQKRGAIFSSNISKLLGEFAYTCHFNATKELDTTESAIEKFIFCRPGKSWRWSWNRKNEEVETGVNLQSWLFIKQYDFNKLSASMLDHLKEKRVSHITVNDDWVVIFKTKDGENYPSELNSIFNDLEGNMFMFAVFRVKEARITEFAKLWKGHGSKSMG